MNNQKHSILSIYFRCLIVLVLISLACAITPQKEVPASPPPLAASQEVVINPEPDPDPEANPDPEPDPDPEADPDPEPPAIIAAKSMELGASGFGQNGTAVGYGVLLNNPNPDLAFENSQYQIAVYNAEGTVLTTDGGYIETILASQKLGIGGTIYLDEGQTAARIEVQFNEGRVVVSELKDSLSADKITYATNEYYSTARGVITNHYDQDISYLQVAAIFYDDAGEIIGGGTTYLNFLLANTSAGIIIPVTSNGEIARVEMFPSITGFFEDVSEQYPEGASKLEVSKQGFGQGERNIGYGMMIKNPNQDYALEGSMYQITAYTNDGNVAGVYEGYVDLLLPNQILGFGGEMYLEEEVAVSRIDVQIKEGVFTPSNANSSLTSKNVTFIPDDYSPKVTGEIMNPYDKEVTNIPVYALGFNEAGEIIGGGNTYLDFIPANASSAVTVNITFSETPASVELYAGVRSISDTGG